MTSAEATIRHCILSGLIENWHKKQDEDWPKLTVDAIIKKLFDPVTIWAIEEHIKNASKK